MSRERTDQLLFDRIAREYARKDLFSSSSLARERQLLSALKRVFDERSRLGTVVEVGCGIGAPARYLDGYYDQYLGIDQSEEMIRAAAAFNQANPKARFIASNVKSRDLPRDVADLVLSVGALHHMTELDKVMNSLGWIARPGAMLVAVEPQDRNPLIQAMRYARGLADQSYSREQVFFSEEELVDLLARGGFEVLGVDFQGFLSPPFAQVVIQPQILSEPLSRLAVGVDAWLCAHLPEGLKKLSFNIVVTGKFHG